MRFDMNALEKGLMSLEDKSHVAVRAFADTGAIKMKSYAQNNAPWVDRTGAARGRLNSYTQDRGDIIRIVVAHGVDYGIYLELANEKKYAIIPQTIQTVGQGEIMPAFQGMLERL